MLVECRLLPSCIGTGWNSNGVIKNNWMGPPSCVELSQVFISHLATCPPAITTGIPLARWAECRWKCMSLPRDTPPLPRPLTASCLSPLCSSPATQDDDNNTQMASHDPAGSFTFYIYRSKTILLQKKNFFNFFTQVELKTTEMYFKIH